MSVHPLADIQNSSSIEELVSGYLRKRWRVNQFRDMNDFSSHPSAILSGDDFSVFAKFSAAANAAEQFEVELSGLQVLASRAGVMTPTPIGLVTVEAGVVLVLEAVPEVDRTEKQWREIGRTLAQIHRCHGSQFGLESNCYFGPFFQDNRTLDDWPTFYAERRLWLRFAGAISAGRLPADVIHMIEKFILRIPQLCGPDVQPTLLHGDAQQNNFISMEKGTVVIDPAVYYGHPEIDLAYLDYFRPIPAEVFAGYQELLPIEAGFWERRELWRVYGYLAIVEVEGAAFLPQLIAAVRKYL